MDNQINTIRTYPHISIDRVAKIEEVASHVESLERGTRQAMEVHDNFVVNQIRRFTHETKKLPKANIRVYYTMSENLGTKKHPHVIKSYSYIGCTVDDIRYTDKSLIVTRPSGHKCVIRLDSILGYVW